MEDKSTQLDLVKNFMMSCQQWSPSDPQVDVDDLTDKDVKNAKLRLTLSLEKLQELFQAMICSDKQDQDFDPFFSILNNKVKNLTKDDLDLDRTSIALYLSDLNYINNGTAIWLNIPLDECFEEVHKANMRKIDPVLNKPLYREDGKVLYNSSYYSPPNIKYLLDKSS